MNDREESSAARYHFIVPVWGARYVDMFVNYSLPSQLCSGNIPALPSGMTTYEIFTSVDDVPTLANAASVQQLRRFANVVIKTFCDQDVQHDLPLHDYVYVRNLQKMTWCYQQSMNGCRGVDAAFVFMTPDSIWGNGAFRFMHECQSSGVRALMALGLITIRSMVQDRLVDFAAAHEPNAIDISPRQLVTLACDALHPLSIARIVKDGGNRFHCAYFWRQSGQGLVARSFYLHPIMVRPRVQLERVTCTVDYRYVQESCPNIGDVRVVTDSDDLFYIDMAELAHVGDHLTLENYSSNRIVEWMCEWTDAYHHAYFRHSIVLHEHEVGDVFANKMAEAETFAAALLEKYDKYYPTCGRTLSLTNVFAPEPSVPLPRVGVWRKVLRKIRRAPRRAVSLLFLRPFRYVYGRLFGKLIDKLHHLEYLVAHYKSLQDGWKPHLIRTEYELERKMDALHALIESLQAGESQPGLGASAREREEPTKSEHWHPSPALGGRGMEEMGSVRL